MSELAQAIEEMRNMRESYDQLSNAAEAYNEGKPALAEAITAKGVEAAATDSLATMAEKVMTISQDTYEIDGGEMYAKQLFGSLETPNYWNLYEVLAQLLSDGRLVNYGGILLAEYYRGYDSLALAGAGAGGAYVVSDKDEQGNFKMYTEDITHTWATEFDGKGNRWVAYCFADEYHDFQITDTNTSPRSIFIGRKVGTITCLVNTRISQIVVPDGNELKDFLSGAFTHNWNLDRTIMRIKEHRGGDLIYNGRSESYYIEFDNIVGVAKILDFQNVVAATAIIFNCPQRLSIQDYTGSLLNILPTQNLSLVVYKNLVVADGIILLGSSGGSHITNPSGVFILIDTETLIAKTYSFIYFYVCKKLYLPVIEEVRGGKTFANADNIEYIYIGYKYNDKTRGVYITDYAGKRTKLTDIELKDGFCKPLNISLTNVLTKENVQAHIFDRLGVNDLSTGAVTITLANVVLNLFTQEEIDAVVARTNITIVGA